MTNRAGEPALAVDAALTASGAAAAPPADLATRPESVGDAGEGDASERFERVDPDGRASERRRPKPHPHRPTYTMDDANMDSLGALMGDKIGGNFGFGGLGLRGTGRGAGERGEGTIGLGNLRSRSAGSGYGRGAGNWAGTISTGVAEVSGGLSVEVVTRIVRRHINEVRFCYHKGLEKAPRLAGELAVGFTIGTDGAVSSTAVARSSLANRQVRQCVLKAVGSWTFPTPDDGAEAHVVYSFILRNARR